MADLTGHTSSRRDWRHRAHQRCTLALLIAACTLAAPRVSVAQPRPVPSGDTLKAIMATATIVFYGELLGPGSTVPGLRPTNQTWLIRLLTPIRLPRVMQYRTTDTLTIALRSDPPADTNRRAVFYAHGWVAGRGYAVIEDARFAAAADFASTLPLWSARTDSAVASLADDRLKAELDSAAVVVIARVEGLMTRRLGERRSRLEHHPMWRDARLRVRTYLKADGRTRQGVLSAIIPGSRDIAWHDIPPVDTGNTYLFVLVDPDARAGDLPGLRPSDRYAVTRSLHVLPVADSLRVQRLLRSGPIR